MTAILCLALLGQIRTIEDGAMAYAVENSLIDWQRKPAYLSDLVPEPAATRILLLGNTEYRFRQLAYNDLKGDEFVRPLFVGMRMRDANTRMLCRQLLLKTLVCPTCMGRHRCSRYVADETSLYGLCAKCGDREWQHRNMQCDLCHGAGYLIDIEDWPEPRPFVNQD